MSEKGYTFTDRLSSFRSLVDAIKQAQEQPEMSAVDSFVLKLQMDATCATWNARTKKQKQRLWDAVKRWAVPS